MYKGKVSTSQSAAGPLRAHTGGYLRSPFTISGAFAEAAEKYVGGSSTSLQAWKKYSAEGEDGESASSGGEGRQWTRAGVGAGKLSVRDRRAQQSNAERVYSDQAGLFSKEAQEVDSLPSESLLQSSQGHMFGVDNRDKETMKKLMTRKIKQERFRRGVSSSGVSSSVTSEQAKMEKETEEPFRVAKRSRDEQLKDERESNFKTVLEPIATAVPSSSSASTKPVSRMQMLQRMREEALFGRNKKKRKN